MVMAIGNFSNVSYVAIVVKCCPYQDLKAMALQIGIVIARLIHFQIFILPNFQICFACAAHGVEVFQTGVVVAPGVV